MHFLETKLPAPVVALLLGAAMKWFALTHPGIVDPTKVCRSALENAASVASTVLTTEAMVVNIPEPPAPAPAAPDMGGMY